MKIFSQDEGVGDVVYNVGNNMVIRPDETYHVTLEVDSEQSLWSR